MNIDELKLLSERSGFPICDHNVVVEEDVLQLLDKKIALEMNTLPFRFDDSENKIYVAISDPDNLWTVDYITMALSKFEVVFHLMDGNKLKELVEYHYVGKEIDKQFNNLLGDQY